MTEQKTTLVTGGARGIGEAACVAFRDAGWRVIAGDLPSPQLETLNQSESSVEAVELDVADEASAKSVVQKLAKKFGRLDALVNNAGVQVPGPFEDLGDDTWRKIFDVNFFGVVTMMREAAQVMLPQNSGSIINISSVSSARGAPGRAPYGATKAAVNSITQAASVEWAGRGVRVNAVAPGYVKTDLVDKGIAAGDIALEPILRQTPMKRMAAPSEIARAILFLASEDASFITGQTLFVDGGFIANYGVPGRSNE